MVREQRVSSWKRAGFWDNIKMDLTTARGVTVDGTEPSQ